MESVPPPPCYSEFPEAEALPEKSPLENVIVASTDALPAKCKSVGKQDPWSAISEELLADSQGEPWESMSKQINLTTNAKKN